MIIKNLVSVNTMLLAISTLLAVPAWADTSEESAPPVESVEMVDGDTAAIECVTQADVDAMSDEEKEKLELPVCEEGEDKEESSDKEEPSDK